MLKSSISTFGRAFLCPTIRRAKEKIVLNPDPGLSTGKVQSSLLALLSITGGPYTSQVILRPHYTKEFFLVI